MTRVRAPNAARCCRVAGAKSPASRRSRRRDSVTKLSDKPQAHPPLVSVLLPVFNAERFVKEALGSITAQTYDNLEILVIDDGSTDKSMEVVKQFRDTRIRIFKDGTQRGVTHRLNQGLMSSKGKYIARMVA
ncbi:MAG: glycosyltransferase family 2 protein, partial [Gammaproteobacteria bacterium]|nr:glycosyltransferase family 2 protein [Gammaproteobacteria bacterium]